MRLACEAGVRWGGFGRFRFVHQRRVSVVLKSSEGVLDGDWVQF